MAHDININEKTGKASYVGAKPAWHGLGQVLDNPFTAEEAIREGGLDFEVEKVPTIYKIGRKEQVIEDKFAVIRTDNQDYLGTVGKVYTPLQNRDAFSFFDALVEKDEAIYHTAGVLGKGERVWVLAKMPDYIRVGKDDLIEQYVLLYNSHDGSTAITAQLTSVRVVCNNTLTAAISQAKNKVSIRHTKNAGEKLIQASEILGLSSMYKTEMEEIFNAMANTKVNTKKVNKFLDALYPLNPENDSRTMGVKFREAILNDFENGVGQDLVTTKGTVFGLYNAVTHYTDHTKEYSNANAKLKSIWFGGSKKIRQNAFDYAVVLAQG